MKNTALRISLIAILAVLMQACAAQPEEDSQNAQAQAETPVPVADAPEEVPETENLRAYLEGEFWGIMRRDADLLVWKALIAPERAPARE